VFRWVLLGGAAVSLIACKGGDAQCDAVELDSPVSSLDTEPTNSTGTPQDKKGPVDEILYCRGCRAAGNCGADCTEPLFQQGQLLMLPGTMQTFDGYPQLSNEYAVCDVWAFEGKVKAVWWAPMY